MFAVLSNYPFIALLLFILIGFAVLEIFWAIRRGGL